MSQPQCCGSVWIEDSSLVELIDDCVVSPPCRQQCINCHVSGSKQKEGKVTHPSDISVAMATVRVSAAPSGELGMGGGDSQRGTGRPAFET